MHTAEHSWPFHPSYEHAIAQKTDGSLWAWGCYSCGNHPIGLGNYYSEVPTRVGTDTSWVAVSTGLGHTLALKSDGSLWAWGYNRDGQLGDGTTTGSPVPKRIW